MARSRRRNAHKERRKIREVIARAVQKSRVPGAPSLGTTPGAQYSTGIYISPGIQGDNYTDENGNPIRSFMLGVDALGDPHRPLMVKGKKRRFYG
jgi:hypothetical protein